MGLKGQQFVWSCMMQTRQKSLTDLSDLYHETVLYYDTSHKTCMTFPLLLGNKLPFQYWNSLKAAGGTMWKVGVNISTQPDSSVTLCKLRTHTHITNKTYFVVSFHELGITRVLAGFCAPLKKKKIMRKARFVLVWMGHAEVTLTSWHFPSILTGRTKSLLCSCWKRAEKQHASEQTSFSFVLITFDKEFDRHSYQWSCMVELHSNSCFGRSYTVAMWLMLTLPDQYWAFGYRLLRALCYLDWYGEGERDGETSRGAPPL